MTTKTTSMKRTTIGLPQDLHANLRSGAKRKKVSLGAEIVRRLTNQEAHNGKVDRLQTELSDANEQLDIARKERDAARSKVDAMNLSAVHKNKEYDDLLAEYQKYRKTIHDRNSNAFKRFLNIFRG